MAAVNKVLVIGGVFSSRYGPSKLKAQSMAFKLILLSIDP